MGLLCSGKEDNATSKVAQSSLLRDRKSSGNLSNSLDYIACMTRIAMMMMIICMNMFMIVKFVVRCVWEAFSY